MNEEAPKFPTVRSDVLGEIVFRPDSVPAREDEPAWICKVPTALWARPERGRDHLIEVYIAGSAQSPDAARLALAERSALDMQSIEAACQEAFKPHFDDEAQQEFWLMWISFGIAHPEPRWEAAFCLTSHDEKLNDTYGLWIVTMSNETPLSVRRDNW